MVNMESSEREVWLKQALIFMADRYFNLTDRKIRNHMGKLRC